MAKVAYKIYATLLDGFYDYVNSDEIWERYYGYSDNPSISPEAFNQKQFQNLIDRINRVPFQSDAADRGTSFNEVIDCMVLNKNSKTIKIVRWYSDDHTLLGVRATMNGKDYYFPIHLIREVAGWYKGGLPQQHIQAILPTTFGDVLLYGYIDYVMPFKTCDLKTTSNYWFGKFKHHWQHIVYPYCLEKNGADVRDFEYNVVEWKSNSYETYKECYLFRPERDIPKLTLHVEDLIRFLEDNRELITDKKIFAQI